MLECPPGAEEAYKRRLPSTQNPEVKLDVTNVLVQVIDMLDISASKQTQRDMLKPRLDDSSTQEKQSSVSSCERALQNSVAYQSGNEDEIEIPAAKHVQRYTVRDTGGSTAFLVYIHRPTNRLPGIGAVLTIMQASMQFGVVLARGADVILHEPGRMYTREVHERRLALSD